MCDHPKNLWIYGLLLAAVLNMGTIRKQEDPIIMTQTGPISLKDKLEETKDGEKGPALPSFKHYPKHRFLAHPPYEENPPEEGLAGDSGIPAWGEPIPEDLEGYEDEYADEVWWEEDDEETTEPGAVSEDTADNQEGKASAHRASWWEDAGEEEYSKASQQS